MLEVQKYLITPGKSLDTLTADYGIKVRFKDHLVKLAYDQIESPKMHPITMECRGLVLNRFTLGLVGGCFRRFFNYGEAADITSKFDWNCFSVYTKEDGSWISVFFDVFSGKWRATTRNSFADMEMFPGGPIWEELVFELLGGKEKWLDKNCTYIFELCTLFNKVIREYREPKLVLLGVINNTNYVDLTDEAVDVIAEQHRFARPERFEFGSVEEIYNYLREITKDDATFEGVVLRDHNGLRMKIKTLTYCSLHLLKGEGQNMFMPKYILPFVLNGEESELLTYFPEVKPNFEKVRDIFHGWITDLSDIYEVVRGIEDKKEFALAVNAYRHPFTPVLFNCRRHSTTVESEFRSASPDSANVHKVMFFQNLVEQLNKEMKTC